MVLNAPPSESPEEHRPLRGEPGPMRSAQAPDPYEHLAQADKADRILLRLVLCAAAATLTLAVAASLSM